MLDKKFKQFGIWMDNRHATIVGVSQSNEADGFKVLANVKEEKTMGNSEEHTLNNDKQRHLRMFFKDVSHQMQNAEEIYVTGISTVQEEFKSFLSDTPQFKNVKVHLDTDAALSDDALVEKVKKVFGH